MNIFQRIKCFLLFFLIILCSFISSFKLQSWTIGNVVTERHSAKISLHLGAQFGNANSRVQKFAPELDWDWLV
jgi:hypothetical protein